MGFLFQKENPLEVILSVQPCLHHCALEAFPPPVGWKGKVGFRGRKMCPKNPSIFEPGVNQKDVKKEPNKKNTIILLATKNQKHIHIFSRYNGQKRFVVSIFLQWLVDFLGRRSSWCQEGTNKHPRKEAVRNPEPPLTRSREQNINTFETVYTQHVYHKNQFGEILPKQCGEILPFILVGFLYIYIYTC